MSRPGIYGDCHRHLVFATCDKPHFVISDIPGLDADHAAPGGVAQVGHRGSFVPDSECGTSPLAASSQVSSGQAFAVLDRLKVIKLAVSLGGTETLASHPAAMTHSDIPEEERLRLGITPTLIRISVGIEDPDDLIVDLNEALG
jgi:Cys/Met metabolism PLP-dependent enzyme